MKLLTQWVDHRYIIFLCQLNRWMNNLHYPYENLEVGTFLFDLGKINETRELIPEFYHCLAATQFSSVQLLSHVWLFAVPWITACQASLSITNSRSLLKSMFIESVMPSNHLILCHPLLLLPPIPPSIEVFSNESTLLMRWPKYWSFRFNISPSNEHPGLISFRMDWLDLLVPQETLKSLLQHHSSKASILWWATREAPYSSIVIPVSSDHFNE